MAKAPAGVTPDMFGVAPGMEGVRITGVDPPPPRRWLDGVSSQRDRRLLPGVGVAPIWSSPVPRSVRGVSAHPIWLGVSPIATKQYT